MKPIAIALLLTGAALGVAGCSGSDKDVDVTKPQQKELEPVTLKLHQTGSYFTESDFQSVIAEPVKRKYPHITVTMNTEKDDLPMVLARGDSVDFLVGHNGQLAGYKELGVFTDITPLTQKHNIDLAKFDAGALDTIKSYSDKGELYALPYAINLNAIYYNKDIFDKFGVAYPKDGMMWQDAIEVAKKVTRKDDNIQYKGLEVDDIPRLLFPLSLNLIEGKTNKVMVNGDPYRKVFELGKQLYSIPGNEYKAGANDRFIKDKTLGMVATVNLFSRLKDTQGLNWDIAQFPSYPERPNTFGMYDLHLVIPLQMSKYRDDQMRVLEVLFSDEVQSMMVSKTGRISTLKDPKYTQAFGKDMAELQGKNVAGIFKSKPAPAPENSVYYSKSLGLLRAEFANAMNDTKDINTALRDAEEKIKQQIETLKSGGK